MVGGGVWVLEGTYDWTVTSKAFSGKAPDTYSYKTEQCGTFFGSTSCWESEGPESVTVEEPPAPTASISWNPATVDYGESSTLIWSSTDATACTMNGNARATSGSWVGTNRRSNQTVTLICTGPGGTSAPAEATLTVNPIAPDAPDAPDVTAGDGELAVEWDAPAENGAPITGYDVRYKRTSSSSWVNHSFSGTGTSTTIGGLTNGTEYEVQVRAQNSAGESDWSASETATPSATATEPDAPAAPSLTAGDEELAVSWTAPNDNGAAIDDYDVRYKRTSSSSWVNHSFSGTGRSTTITGLTNGEEYEVQVRAQNSVGESDWSASAEATPMSDADVPDAPAPPTLTAGNAQLAVSWTAPDDNGASITDYDVRYKRTSAASWVNHSFSGTGRSTTITGLTNAVEYEVQVRAQNAEGESDWSASETATPQAGLILTVLPATSYDGEYTVDWGIARCFNVPFGGGQVCRDLQERIGSSGAWTTVSGIGTTATSHAFSGKAVGTYYYRLMIGTLVVGGPVRAEVEDPPVPTASISWNPATVNYGESSTLIWSSTDATACTMNGNARATSGSWVATNRTVTQTVTLICTGPGGTSAPAEATLTVNPIAPDAPDAPDVTAGDGELAVEWDAPAENGASITGYDVRYKRTSSSSWVNHSFSGTGTSTTIGGLTNGTEYEVQVRAQNSAGESDWSASETATPSATATEPDAPAAPSLTAGDEELAVSWTAPNDNGAAIDDYDVRYKRTSSSSWVNHSFSGTGRSTTITGLTNGEEYEVQVRAQNSVGESDWSASAEATPMSDADVPDAPAPPTLTAGNAQLAVSWTAPDDNGASITDYDVRYKRTNETNWTDHGFSGTGTSTTITGLTNAVAYEVQVRAQNAEGESDWSASETATPTAATGPPAVPVAPTLTVGDTQLAVAWVAPADNGASITDYDVQYKSTSDTGWTDHSFSGTGTSTTITSLTNGTAYEVQVRAENAQGESDWSASETALPTNQFTLTVSPATSTDGSYTVSWGIARCFNIPFGNTQVCRELQERAGVDGTWTAVPGVETAATSKAFSYKAVGTYYYRLVLGTVVVAGAASVAVTGTVMPEPPDAPALTVMTGTGQLRVEWDEPSDNGSPISDYDVA